MILSAALDLGTTRIKGALLDERGKLTRVIAVSAPRIKGAALIRESDPTEYIEIAESVLAKLYRGLPNTVPLGVASQRSSFLLWERDSSKPVTPLISWMDRRALTWVRDKTLLGKSLIENTGLPFSPHYAGPKLASLLEGERGLRVKAERGLILFGTLESYLLWLWTRGDLHLTDITMASRTLMVDLNTGEWSKEKLSLYQIPELILPKITTSNKLRVSEKNGREIRAIPADQPSAFYASSFACPETPVVNLGTGGFIMSPCNKNRYSGKGLLYTPLYSGKEATLSYGLEGTINGITVSLKRVGGANGDLSGSLPADTFCIPDSNGVGSPHWNPSLSLKFSDSCSPLTSSERRRVVFEGVIFRVAEIIEAMENRCEEISLFGGLSHNPFFKKGLATCLNKSVRCRGGPEGTLMGAALMSADNFTPLRETNSITYPSKNQTIKEKYLRWREWVQKIIPPKLYT